MSHSIYVIPEHFEAPRPDSAVIRVGRMLTEIRLKNSLTQAELAKAIGSTQANVARIEKGRSSPTLSMLEKIARHYGSELLIGFKGHELRADRQHMVAMLGRRRRTTVICRY